MINSPSMSLLAFELGFLYTRLDLMIMKLGMQLTCGYYVLLFKNLVFIQMNRKYRCVSNLNIFIKKHISKGPRDHIYIGPII